MRASISHLQRLAIFTTVLTGGGVGTMYFLMQQKFSESDYHRLAVQALEACPVAMESLGAPPLKVHNLHLTDRSNQIRQQTAQIKIPVTGSKSGGYLYTSSFREAETLRWSLIQAVLQLRDGQTFDLLNPPPSSPQNQPGQDLDQNQPGPDLDHNQPGQDLDQNQPGQDLDHNQPGQDLDQNQPGQDLDHNQPGQDLDHNQPGQDLDQNQPGQDLDHNQAAEETPGPDVDR